MTPLSDGVVTESDNFTFVCELSKPQKKVTWYKGDQTISLDDAHFTISNDDYKYSLTLNECTLDDGAEYTVKCDDVSTTATLKVKGKIFVVTHFRNKCVVNSIFRNKCPVIPCTTCLSI